MRFRQLLPLIGALFSLYIIWGSTYFVIRIGVESWPPLMMAGIRFLSAGVLLLAFLLLRGHKLPPLRPMMNAALIGLLSEARVRFFKSLGYTELDVEGVGIVVADAARELDLDVETADDLGEELRVRAAPEGRVQVDEVDPLRAARLPVERRAERVAVRGLGAGLALDEADGLAAGDVDGGQQGQCGHEARA